MPTRIDAVKNRREAEGNAAAAVSLPMDVDDEECIGTKTLAFNSVGDPKNHNKVQLGGPNGKF